MVLDPEANDWEAEAIWYLLPSTNTKFRANGFDKLCSELLAALNDYLALLEFQANEPAHSSFQLSAYVERNLDEFIPSLHDSLIEKLGDLLEKDAKGLLAHFQLAQFFGEHVFRQGRIPRGNLLLEIDAKLNAYFVAKKLELAALIDNYNQSYNAELVLAHTELVSIMLNDPNANFPPLIRLHSIAWLLTNSRRDEYYWQLKELLLAQAVNVSRDQKRVYSHLILNHCAARINEGVASFEVEMDQLHLKLLELEIFIVDGKLPPAQFKNIITVALLNDRIHWVANFLAEWESRLTNDHEGFAQIYNRAVLAFHKADFTDCIRQMETILRDFKEDVFYGLDARIYILMSLFEKGKQEDVGLQLESGLNAFRLYLRREKRLGDARKARYSNLIKQFRRLITVASEPPDKRKKKAEKLIKILNSLQPGSNRKWFLKQVEGLSR